MKILKFNINNTVRVRLTDVGRKIHKETYERDMRCYLEKYPYEAPKEDTNGYSEWQMWDLMRIFGAHCYNGCHIPFETQIEIIHV